MAMEPETAAGPAKVLIEMARAAHALYTAAAARTKNDKLRDFCTFMAGGAEKDELISEALLARISGEAPPPCEPILPPENDRAAIKTALSVVECHRSTARILARVAPPAELPLLNKMIETDERRLEHLAEMRDILKRERDTQ